MSEQIERVRGNLCADQMQGGKQWFGKRIQAKIREQRDTHRCQDDYAKNDGEEKNPGFQEGDASSTHPPHPTPVLDEERLQLGDRLRSHPRFSPLPVERSVPISRGPCILSLLTNCPRRSPPFTP